MLEASNPDVMVCIGGMEGLEDEVALTLERGRIPIYVLERTGGAAALLGGRYSKRLRMIDTEVMARIDHFRAEFGATMQLGESHMRRSLVPYPLVMQTIIEEIAQRI